MKKTKHFNISVPELGDVPDITQVSNAISDLEDATAGTLEIMKAEMQGTKITLTSVSRKTKRTGYYEGMSIRFKSPQDIEPNYLKTISVDGLGDQTLSVGYKVNRNEYIDIVYEGNKFTAYPVVVQKTDSVSENSSILVGTAKSVKTAYDKGVEALNKANQAQSSANNAQSTADKKVNKSGDTMTGALTIKADTADCLNLYADGNAALRIRDKSGSSYRCMVGYSGGDVILWNGVSDTTLRLKSDGSALYPAKNLTTSNKEVVQAVNELNSGKVSKSGDTMTGALSFVGNSSEAQFYGYKDADNDLNNLIPLYRAGWSYSTWSTKYDIKNGFNMENNANGVLSYSTFDGSHGHQIGLSSDGNLYHRILRVGDNFSKWAKIWTSANINPDNLQTKSKEVIGAINELNDNKLTKTTKVGKYTQLQKQGIYVGDVGIYVGGNNGVEFSTDVSKTIYFGYDTFGDNPVESYKFCNGDGNGTLGTIYAKEVISNTCPYNAGDIYITTKSGNPSSIWLGTTWDKIEGRFLLGTSGGASAGATGGSMSKSISVANLPSHNHSGSQSEHSHYMFANTTGGSHITASNVKEKAPSYKAVLRNTTDRDDYVIAGNNESAAYGRTSNAGGGVSVGYTGSGSALDVTPSYYTVHIWKRRG